ncbi:MAG: UDP-N-acetylmuramoyl-L-alanyl-D-glutamate--2,6-diaminopimelate ligase [Candidatus Saccharimonadales bacterium]|nr:UDP-N-acetylmuramoyl-L-alanyl-D-glutamate--2,6-diaminopimelate ligase [Candidatus Saccharimonadales bacterium]
MKKRLKKLIPEFLYKPLLPLYHWLQAFTAQAVNGFPASNMNVIGVTGTNGKTTTISLLASILEASGYRVGVITTAFYKIDQETITNEDNMTVVPPFQLAKMLKKMKQAKLDWIVLEVTSHALVQHRTLGIPIDTAVMTNLTQDHLDYHGSMDNYAAAKGRLFKKTPRNIVLNKDDEWYNFFDKYAAKENKITYGTDELADCRITRAELNLNGTELTMILQDKRLKAKTHLAGKFNAYNALAAAATADAIGIQREAISHGLDAVKVVPGRMDPVISKRGFQVFVDYAHTADALQNVLETLKHLTHGRVIVVFGATGDRDKSKRPVMGKVVSELADIAIVTDDDPYNENPLRIREDVLSGMKDGKGFAETYEIGDRRGAIAKAIELARKPDSILVAGMGHQTHRIVAGKKEHYNDRETVEELLQKA